VKRRYGWMIEACGARVASLYCKNDHKVSLTATTLSEDARASRPAGNVALEEGWSPRTTARRGLLDAANRMQESRNDGLRLTA